MHVDCPGFVVERDGQPTVRGGFEWPLPLGVQGPAPYTDLFHLTFVIPTPQGSGPTARGGAGRLCTTWLRGSGSGWVRGWGVHAWHMSLIPPRVREEEGGFGEDVPSGFALVDLVDAAEPCC